MITVRFYILKLMFSVLGGYRVGCHWRNSSISFCLSLLVTTVSV